MKIISMCVKEKNLPQLRLRMRNISLDRDVRNSYQLALIYTINCMTAYTSNLPTLRDQYQVIRLHKLDTTYKFP